MKKETKKLIAAGIVMALSCGAWGSVSAADPNVATKGEDKNVNSIYSDGKIREALIKSPLLQISVIHKRF